MGSQRWPESDLRHAEHWSFQPARINRDAWDTPSDEAKLLQLIPYGRIGDVGDVAQGAVWLASDQSDYVTGATLYVDGGLALYPAFRFGG